MTLHPLFVKNASSSGWKTTIMHLLNLNCSVLQFWEDRIPLWGWSVPISWSYCGHNITGQWNGAIYVYQIVVQTDNMITLYDCQHCIITYYHNKMIQSNKCWRLILLGVWRETMEVTGHCAKPAYHWWASNGEPRQGSGEPNEGASRSSKLSRSIFTCRLFVCSFIRPASVTWAFIQIIHRPTNHT